MEGTPNEQTQEAAEQEENGPGEDPPDDTEEAEEPEDEGEDE